MSFHWRIRHKLMLGLGQVVGIIALLLAGTLYGLISYRATMKSIESKLVELKEAEIVKEVIKNLKDSSDSSAGTADEVQKLLVMIHSAREALDDYEIKLDNTVNSGRDPDQGFSERGNVSALREKLTLLEEAAKNVKDQPRVDSAASKSVMDDPAVKDLIDKLMSTSSDLLDSIYLAQGRLSREARRHYNASLWIVASVSVCGVLLLCGLLRFFYGWVFYPIRDLEQGAERVAQGDFEHRIEVHSGDEMEDLAAAFNNMTSRLRDMYRDLARQVNERSRQLVRSERLVSVGFLAAGVAHEINNPLASIAFCSESLEKRLADFLGRSSVIRGPWAEGQESPRVATRELASDDREVIAKYLKMIQQEAFRCKDITQRLLEFSRGGERTREPADLAEIVQAVIDMVEHLENSKGKHIVFDVAHGAIGRVVAWVNAQEIKSVVLNLVVNALDSMDEGGTLTISQSQHEGMALLVFADTGCGMTSEVLENIFEPFYTRSRTGRGTGLGLSISHRVISLHGGEIEAVSPGLHQGSTFTVRLPLQPAEPVKEETIGHVAA